VGMPGGLLPEILESNQIGGKLIRDGASELGLPVGMPVLAGMIDTSAAMLLTGARPGQLLNTCGSTDVLALLTDRPHVNEHLITRAFGIGRKWMSVSTVAAAGSAILWAHDQLFSDYSWARFKRLLGEVSKGREIASEVFTPYLAGDRMSVEQRTGAINNLTLATKREDILKAIVDSLATNSAARLPLLCKGQRKILRRVVVSGQGFDEILRRDWRGRWSFVRESEASLRGLSKLVSA
ncbi:MAG TPA: FGGY-family carbohydrate kinase, partial [Tepidisphaeraceae bacterium]|nr:FGGY-family carbohydrate kinase [Tepidisphaeraceae bacterium]